MGISDMIEEFIKDLFDEQNEAIEIQRNELAEQFKCVPSQINYVISTRFKPSQGYYVESKRGGGGNIKIRKINPEGRLRAIISITIDDMLAIHDIKVVQGDERLFVAMPSRRDENGMFRDIVHPISPEARGSIEGQILDAYTRHIELMQAELEAEQSGTIL